MARWPDVAAIGALRGEADSVIDDTARDLVVAEDTGPDRQAGGIGTRPSIGAKVVPFEIEYRTGPRRRPAAIPRSGEELVEDAGVPVQHECVRAGRGLDG